jgi:hypothetical protein
MPRVRETKHALHKQKKNMTVLVKIKSMLPATARAKDDIHKSKRNRMCEGKDKHHSEFVIMSKRGRAM